MNTNREERFGISGGRFVEPAANMLLPPTRDARLQGGISGGRFVQSGETNQYHMQGRITGISWFDPAERYIHADWDHAYHFGGLAR